MGDAEQPARKARVDDIVTLAARIWNVSRKDLLSSSRYFKHVRPRQAVFLIAREHGHSFPLIGIRCGDRDHSTVMYGVGQAENYCQRDPAYRAKVELLREQAMEAEAFIVQPVKVSVPPPVPVVEVPRPPKLKARNVFANDDRPFDWQERQKAKHIKQDIAFIAALSAAGGHRRAA